MQAMWRPLTFLASSGVGGTQPAAVSSSAYPTLVWMALGTYFSAQTHHSIHTTSHDFTSHHFYACSQANASEVHSPHLSRDATQCN